MSDFSVINQIIHVTKNKSIPYKRTESPCHNSKSVHISSNCLHEYAAVSLALLKGRKNERNHLNVFGRGRQGGVLAAWLEACSSLNSPIFSLRLVYMTVGAPSHFASFVLKQVLHSLSFAGELHFKVIVHFHHCLAWSVWTPSFIKASFWEATVLLQRARFGISAGCLPQRGPFSF